MVNYQKTKMVKGLRIISGIFFIIRLLIILIEFSVCFLSVLIIYVNFTSRSKEDVNANSFVVYKVIIFCAVFCFAFAMIISALFLRINLLEYFIPRTDVTEPLGQSISILDGRDRAVADVRNNNYSGHHIEQLTIMLENDIGYHERLKKAVDEVDSYVDSIVTVSCNPLAIIPPPNKDIKRFIPISTIDMFSRVFVIPMSILGLICLPLLIDIYIFKGKVLLFLISKFRLPKPPSLT